MEKYRYIVFFFLLIEWLWKIQIYCFNDDHLNCFQYHHLYSQTKFVCCLTCCVSGLPLICMMALLLLKLLASEKHWALNALVSKKKDQTYKSYICGQKFDRPTGIALQFAEKSIVGKDCSGWLLVRFPNCHIASGLGNLTRWLYSINLDFQIDINCSPLKELCVLVVRAVSNVDHHKTQ